MHRPKVKRGEEIDERSGYELRESLWKQPPPIVYNPNVPTETFDVIMPFPFSN